jgi:pyridoxal phosphate-dependent aminotransferase EpsN
MQPLFKDVDFFTHKDDVSVSEQLFNKGICLPSGTHMTEEGMERVIDCLQRALM